MEIATRQRTRPAYARKRACRPNCHTENCIPVEAVVERLNKEFGRRITRQTELSVPEAAAMLLWALLASGKTGIRKGEGWQTHDHPLDPDALDDAA